MATIKFFIQSKKNPASIYLSLSLAAKSVFKRKTGYTIDPRDWSIETNLPKKNAVDHKNLKTDLGKLKTAIEENLNNAVSKGEEITGEWLQSQIDKFLGTKKKTDPDRITTYIETFIENLPYKEYPNGKRGVAKGTLQKYATLKNKIADFEKDQKKKFYIKDVNLKFRNDLLKYFTEVDKLSSNSAGRYIRFLKTICLDAQLNGIIVNSQLAQIKGFTEKAEKVFLTFDELETIENKSFTRAALENAKDWLIIGCYIGQRVSDLLPLKSKNINVRSGLELIELVQKKTGKDVSIPIHPKVKEILNKRNGEFPGQISAPKFNLHIKDLCKIAKIDQPTEGAKLIALGEGKEIKWRKEHGTFPKYELITSHVCRRSFASNFYGDMPTALLMSITGHATEQQFLQYIGKKTNDYAIQIAEYWTKQQLKANDQAPMTVLKNAKSK